MLDIPVSLKVLACLKENQSKNLNLSEIANKTKEDLEHVDRSLKELVQRNIVIRNEEGYSYVSSQRSDEFLKKIFELYDIVGRRHLEKLLIRGLLHKAPLQMNDFLNLMETEGYDREEIRSLLEEDITNGYVKKVKFPELNHLHYPFLRRFFWFIRKRPTNLTDYEGLTNYLKRQGLNIEEKDFLIGLYPSELLNPAKEYVDKEHKDLRRKMLYNSLHIHLLYYYLNQTKI